MSLIKLGAERGCSHATARASRRFRKHRRLFVVDKRISMSMGGCGGGLGGGRTRGEDGDTPATKRSAQST